MNDGCSIPAVVQVDNYVAQRAECALDIFEVEHVSQAAERSLDVTERPHADVQSLARVSSRADERGGIDSDLHQRR